MFRPGQTADIAADAGEVLPLLYRSCRTALPFIKLILDTHYLYINFWDSVSMGQTADIAAAAG